MVPKCAHFMIKDLNSNLLNDIEVYIVENYSLKKIIEFEKLLMQIRINLDLQTDPKKKL